MMSDLEETHKSCPSHWPRNIKVCPELAAYSLGVLTPGQALISNQPELKVQTPEDSQNLDLKHPSLTDV